MSAESVSHTQNRPDLNAYARWLHDQRVAAQHGAGLYALLMVVATEQDRSGLISPVPIREEELCVMISASRPTVQALRNRAVAADLLRYEPGSRRQRATYAVVVPNQNDVPRAIDAAE